MLGERAGASRPAEEAQSSAQQRSITSRGVSARITVDSSSASRGVKQSRVGSHIRVGAVRQPAAPRADGLVPRSHECHS
eukprot:scaffold109353_cov31-Tisochrysis_lutea.AAC.2